MSAMLMDTALARMLSALAKTMAEERAAAWCARKDRGEARPCPYRVLSTTPGVVAHLWRWRMVAKSRAAMPP